MFTNLDVPPITDVALIVLGSASGNQDPFGYYGASEAVNHPGNPAVEVKGKMWAQRKSYKSRDMRLFLCQLEQAVPLLAVHHGKNARTGPEGDGWGRGFEAVHL